jgi:hypothetical protein
MKLIPIKFKNQTTTLKGPAGQEQGIFPKKIPVHISREHGAYISCWKLGPSSHLTWKERRVAFRERLKFVMGKTPIWMVVYTKGHPPIYLSCESERTMFIKEEGDG